MTSDPSAPSQRTPLVIATSINARYALGGFVALKSAISTAPQTSEPIQVVILDGGIPHRQWGKIEGELKKLPRVLEIRRLSPDLSIFSHLQRDYGNSLMAYARLSLPWLLGTEVKRVLYCDADVVFLRDWTPLWSMDLEGSVIAAAVCPVVRTLGGEDLPINELGLSPETPYLQSGVMLIDMDRWREERISERALDFLFRFPGRARFWDQSALNTVFPGKWREIGEEWNTATFRYHEQPPEKRKLMGILHYSGPEKPWHFRGKSDPCNAHFFAQLTDTIWANWRPSRFRSKLRYVKYWVDRLLGRS